MDSSPPVPAISRPSGLPSSTTISAGLNVVITVGAAPAFGAVATTAATDANSPRAGIFFEGRRQVGDRAPGPRELCRGIAMIAGQQVIAAAQRVAKHREIRVSDHLEPAVAHRRRERLAVDEEQERRRFDHVDRRRGVVEARGRWRFQDAIREVIKENVERNFQRLALDNRADAVFVLFRAAAARERHAIDLGLRHGDDALLAIHARVARQVDHRVARVGIAVGGFHGHLRGEVLEVVPAANLRRVHDELAAIHFALARILPAHAERGIRRLGVRDLRRRSAIATGERQNEEGEAQGRQARRSHVSCPENCARKMRRQCTGAMRSRERHFAASIRIG